MAQFQEKKGVSYSQKSCSKSSFPNFASCKNFSICVSQIHAFSITNTFISNTMLKLAKNQAKVKQHPEAELLLFENYSKLIRNILRNVQKTSVLALMRLCD